MLLIIVTRTTMMTRVLIVIEGQRDVILQNELVGCPLPGHSQETLLYNTKQDSRLGYVASCHHTFGFLMGWICRSSVILVVCYWVFNAKDGPVIQQRLRERSLVEARIFPYLDSS